MADYNPLPLQSPIDLGEALPITYKFPPDYLELHWDQQEYGRPDDTGLHGREIFFDNSQNFLTLKLPGSDRAKRFDLYKLHFHAQSEHHVSGKQWPLELHIVHRTTESDPFNPNGPERTIYAVIGVMVVPKPAGKAAAPKLQEASELFRRLARDFEVMEKEKSEGKDCSVQQTPVFDPKLLLPFEAEQTEIITVPFWRYEGSLTTEINKPNDGYVSWTVLQMEKELEPDAIAMWTVKKHLAKCPQPLDRRFVFFHPGEPEGSTGTPPTTLPTT
jgi:carbonic anhydrase